MSVTTNLGKVGMLYRGSYVSTATYEMLDVVLNQNALFVALKTVTGTTPSDDGVNWRKMIDANPAISEALDAAEAAELLVDINDLRTGELPNTIETIAFEDGAVRTITHTAITGGAVKRIDTFTYTDTAITETRTLQNGAKLVITTNLNTLQTTTVYTPA